MVHESLTEYVQRLLKSGYDVGTIRTELIRTGYPPYQVDQTIRAAQYAFRAPRVVEFTWKKLVFLFIAFIGVVILSFFAYKIFVPKPVEVSLSLDPLLITLEQGDTVRFNRNLLNPSGKKTDVILSYEVIGSESGEVFAEKSEKLPLFKQSSSEIKIALPSKILPGKYSVKTVAKYSKKKSESSFSINVLEKKIVETVSAPPTEIKLEECPGGCNDYNDCTTDTCVGGSCQHEQSTPCCGNKLCESEENPGICPEDCKAKIEKSTPELMSDAKNIAMSNPEKASTLCTAIPEQDSYDQCFSEIAKATNKSNLCNPMQDEATRDSCYMDFALKDDFSVCDKVASRYLKNTCFSLSNIKSTTAA